MNSIEEKINILKVESEERKSGGATAGFHWPKPFRRECVALLESGINLKDLAQQVGVSRKTLERWQTQHLKKVEPPKFREIRVMEKKADPIFLKTSRGYEIYGLSLADVTKLLQTGLI
jgi:DNA-binding XRE family transcriptional regulator